MDNSRISNTYQKIKPGRPLAAIRARAAAGDPRRGWLTAGSQTIPVALGRGGIIANKREGDGGTPMGTFRPRRLWWRAGPPPPPPHPPRRPAPSGRRPPGAKPPRAATTIGRSGSATVPTAIGLGVTT